MDINQGNNSLTSPPDGPMQSWAERNGFAHWALALFWIVIAFILFQVSAGVIALVLFIMREGIQGQPNPQELMNQFMGNLDLMFIGNSFGQIVFLGIATWFFSRLHAVKKEHTAFMRFKTHSNTPRMLVVTAVLIVAAQPVIWFLSWINAQIPVPDFFDTMQSTQMQMIENFLAGDHTVALTLFHIGVVPAVCEEVLYRGYVLRAFEKSWGIWVAIVMSGLMFGLYHVQLTNLLALAFIGMILAYITYASDSIYPAMLAHFINNGSSVLVATFYPNSSIAEMSPETMPPFWALLTGFVLSAWIVYYMYQNRPQVQEGATDV